MKAEIAVLAGKEPFGVRLELSVKEAELIAHYLGHNTLVDKAVKMQEQLNSVIDNVKKLNQQQNNQEGINPK